MMEFFERLREATRARFKSVDAYKAQGFVAGQMYECTALGIDATIEALKEMVVGVPLKGTIELEITQDSTKMEADETTLIQTQFTTKGGAEVWFNEHYSADGRKVVIMVLEDAEKRQTDDY